MVASDVALARGSPRGDAVRALPSQKRVWRALEALTAPHNGLRRESYALDPDSRLARLAGVTERDLTPLVRGPNP